MSSSPQPSASLPPSRPSESAQNGTSDGLDRRYLELAELKKKHEREEREQRDAYEKSRTAIEDDFQNQALQYGMLEGAQELHEQLKKMLRENFTTKLRELEDKYEKEKAALKRRYDEAEMRIWGSLLNLDTGVKALNVHEFTVSAPASKSSTPAQRTPLPNGSASKEGPKVPASSGARRVAGSAEPAARVPLPLASRVPSTGPLAYSPEARHGVPLQPAQALPPHHQLNGGRQVSKNTPPPAGYYPHLAAPRPPPLHDFARHRTPPEEAGASFGRKHYPVQHSMTLLSQPLSTTTAGDRDLRIPSSVAWPHPGHYPSARSTHSHPLAAPLPPMMANRTTSQPPLQPQPHPQYAQQLQAQQLHHQQQQQQLQQPHQQQQPPPQQQQQQRHPLPGLERRELPPILAAPSGPMAAQLDESAKRKAESLAVSSETAAKRPKQSHNIGSSGSNEQQPARTITFAEVYGDGQAEYQHMIIQFPEGGPFYILKCDEHGVHFGEHPLRGAAKHLASAQHGRMSKEHTKAVETLGHRVVDCTVELMEKNNARVMEAFGNGYKPFNANQLSKTKRALKGFPNLDKPATPGASPSGTPIRQRKPPAPVIWDPTIPGLYVGFCVPDQKHYPVIVLPWNEPNLESAGIGMTMADVGLLSQPEKLPKCYVYSREGDRITGISGWAEGYEDGGPLHKRREFAVIYIDNEELDRWQIGWIQAKNLSAFDLERPQPEDLPFFNEAREYYARSIRNFDSYEALRREMFAHRQTTVLQQTAAVAGVANGTGSAGEGSERPAASTPRRPLPSHAPSYEDSEMMDAGASDVESDRASSPKSSPNSDDDVEMANTDSRRTSVSNRDDIPKETSITPGPLAQAIAAQALSLQAPARGSGFTAINSRSSASSVEPASRQGSVERRRVEKIYASSRRQTNGALAPSDSTADKAKDDKLSPQAPSPSPAPPPAVVRKPSPASLQHILQESPDDQSPTLASVESEGQSQNTEVPAPASASATPIVSPQPSSTINVATGLGISNAPSVERAESVPAPPNKSSTQEQERSRSLTPASATTPATPALTVNGLSALRSLPTVQPLPSQYPTPLPSATESTQGRTPVATTSFSRPTEITPAASPVGTPTASALSSRATSPAVASFVTAKTEGTPSSGGQTPVGSSEVEVFEIGRLSVGDKEMFNSTLTGGARFQLIDDLKSGVFKAAEGSPEAVASLEIDPKKVKSAVRVPTESGASCLVKVYFNTTSAEEEKEDDEGKRMELVFEAMTNSKRGAVTGKVLAAKFCRRLKALNNNVDCPLAVA